MYNEVHVTYLDTIGRPTIVFKKSSLTDEHKGTIYVSTAYVSKYHPRC
jgi:oligosaccharyltransferase complex subunit alpha (ribophorin I)